MTINQKYQCVATILLTLLLLCTDQIIKIAVKTGMYLHQSIKVTDWFYLFFTENKGMAFGLEVFDKYFLTSFRLVAVAVLAYIIYNGIRKGMQWGLLFCLVFILAGAAGNIIDCVFYGMIFNNPVPPLRAEFVSWGTGYDGLMLGRVVDMFYFPLVEWDWPSWMPFIGERHFIFFSPIFNFADACISCGVFALFVFYHNIFRR